MSADKVCGCKLATHPQRALLDAACFNKDSTRSIARRYSTAAFAVTKDVVSRHSMRCLGITGTTSAAKAAVKRRSIRATKSAEAEVQRIMDSEPVPPIRTKEAVQLWRERLFARLERRCVVAEAKGDDLRVGAFVVKQIQIISDISQTNWPAPTTAATFNNYSNVTAIDMRKLSDEELHRIVAGEDILSLPVAS